MAIFGRTDEAKNSAGVLLRRAAAARDEQRFRDAAALFREAAALQPARPALHVQAGHMFKEAGDFPEAEDHYLRALRDMPSDADLALQLGHFYKMSGRLDDATSSYRRAKELAPEWDEPARELVGLDKAGWQRARPERSTHDPLPEILPVSMRKSRLDPRVAGQFDELAPEQFPTPFPDMLMHSEPSVCVLQCGVVLRTFWGMRHVLRGVEAIRGFCISDVRIVDYAMFVNGLFVGRGPVEGPFELTYEADRSRIHKYVFNVWQDFSGFAPGPCSIEIRFRDENDGIRTFRRDCVVDQPLLEQDHPESDSIVTLDPADGRSIEDQLAARASVVHEAARPSALEQIRSILVLRTDQLGDTVVSLPALRRLRELFPTAKLVGLVTRANSDLARTFSIFDELIEVEAPDDPIQRKRVMPLEAQLALKARLADYKFDVALDLATSHMSRALLKLAGARFTFGFDDADFSWMTGGVSGSVHDPHNYRETTAHSSRILALVEWLSTVLQTKAVVSRRTDLPRDRLASYGISATDRFAVLHMGARIVFSRWDGYLGLVEKLHETTDLKIVIFPNGPDFAASLPQHMRASGRVIILAQQLPFDDFDAMLSYCAVYVGNDSGPKHLAALRGAPVVSIHSARISWTEWAQEQTGVVVTRKVPCAGCAIYFDVDECGKDYACMKGITVDEVHAAVSRFL